MTQNHIGKVSVNNNPNIGLFGFATEKYCIMDKYAQPNLHKEAEEVLGVKVVQMTLGGTGLCGLFCAGNSNGVVVSSIIRDYELEPLKKAGINFVVVHCPDNAIGNLMAANDNGCIISPMLNICSKEIAKVLGVKVIVSQIGGSDLTGACLSATNRGCMVHKEATEKELKLIKKTLGVEPAVCTVNFGTPWVKSGVIANAKGFLIGDKSSGPEIARADEVLGFLGAGSE